jgi:hypothetical protein
MHARLCTVYSACIKQATIARQRPCSVTGRKVQAPASNIVMWNLVMVLTCLLHYSTEVLFNIYPMLLLFSRRDAQLLHMFSGQAAVHIVGHRCLQQGSVCYTIGAAMIQLMCAAHTFRRLGYAAASNACSALQHTLRLPAICQLTLHSSGANNLSCSACTAMPHTASIVFPVLLNNLLSGNKCLQSVWLGVYVKRASSRICPSVLAVSGRCYEWHPMAPDVSSSVCLLACPALPCFASCSNIAASAAHCAG